MFDIGMTELMVIGIVALIVVGPKDLPGMFRTLGRFTARARGMAREFTRAMEDAAKDSGVSDVSKTIKGVANPKKMGLDALNSAADSFEKWDPLKGKTEAKSPVPAASAKASDADAAEWSAHEAKVRAEQAADAAEMADEPEVTEPAPAKAATKAPAKKSAAKKPAAKKPAAKKPAAKSATTDSADAATKAPAKKPAAKKAPASKTAAAKKPAAKKPAAKKPAAKATAKTATPEAQAPQTEEKGS